MDDDTLPFLHTDDIILFNIYTLCFMHLYTLKKTHDLADIADVQACLSECRVPTSMP